MFTNMNALAAVALIAVIGLASIAGNPRGPVEVAVNAGPETGPLVLAQFNPCPNRKCR